MGKRIRELLFGADKADRKVAIGFLCAMAVMALWLVAIIRGWI